VRGHENVLKRLLVHAGALNLGLWMRTIFGVGTPRSLQGRVVALDALIAAWWALIDNAIAAIWSQHRDHARSDSSSLQFSRRRIGPVKITICTTGC
jgi:transposase